MWNKPEKDPPQRPAMQPRQAPEPIRQAPPAPPPASHGAVIGKTMMIKGEIHSQEDLTIDGEMEGKLEVQSKLTVGPNGKINANVKAKEVIVHGSVHGNVEATDKIAIKAGASIVGDIKTAGIVIDDGAYFKGGIDILRPETARKAAAS
ncbi:MAG: polymer-forming cytoskeletal protein [Bryobacteraceae bacterium]